MCVCVCVCVYLVLLDEQLYGLQVVAVVGGRGQRHPLLHPQLHKRERGYYIITADTTNLIIL